MKRSRAPALPRAAGCPGEPPGTKARRARNVAWCGGSSGAGPSMHLVCGLFPASTGVVDRGSRHAPRQWPLPPALASLGLAWFPDCTGAMGFMPPTFSAFGGYWVPGLHCVRGHALSTCTGVQDSPTLTETGTVLCACPGAVDPALPACTSIPH